MADLRTSFTVLEDFATGAGLPLHKAVEGETTTAKNALAALVAKDNGGNFDYLNTDASGNLKVVSTDSTACLSQPGEVIGGASGFTTVAEVTLATSKSYKDIGWIAGCTRDAEFRIVKEDNGATGMVAEGIYLGAGNETNAEQLDCLMMSSGGTGTQKLRLEGRCLFGYLSDLKGTISVLQV